MLRLVWGYNFYSRGEFWVIRMRLNCNSGGAKGSKESGESGSAANLVFKYQKWAGDSARIWTKLKALKDVRGRTMEW